METQQLLFEVQSPRGGVVTPAVRVRAHQRRVSWAGYENQQAELDGAREHLHAVTAAYAEAVRQHSSRRQELRRAVARAAAVVLRIETRMFGPVEGGER